ARLAFVRIAHQILLAGQGTRHEAPLQAGRKTRAATTTHAGCLDLVDDVFRRPAGGQDLAQGFIAAALHVILLSPIAAIQPRTTVRVDVAIVEDHAGGWIAGWKGLEALRKLLQYRRHTHADSPCCLSSSSMASMRSGCMCTHMCRLLSSITGESPQAPMHSPSFRVNMPSGVVSLKPMLSFCFRYSAALTPSVRAQGRFVHTVILKRPTGCRLYML